MRDYDCHDWDKDGYPGEFVYGDDCYVDDYYMDERWKRIKDYEDYWISNRGRVYGPGRGGNGGFLKLVPQDGYLKVTLTKKGKKCDKRVNRLVAMAFIEKPKGSYLVMHEDDDRTNNSVENLSWGTYADNNRDCWRKGRHPVTITPEIIEKGNAARRVSVIAIDSKTGERTRYRSQHDAARELGVSQQHIWGVLNGYRKTTGGYRFEYANEEECPDAY